MIKIVGFLGVIGSGKTYCAEKLARQNIGFTWLESIADSLRRLCFCVFGDDKKLTTDEYEKFKVATFKTEDGGLSFTGREMLQRIGQEIRKTDSNFWINGLIAQIDEIISRYGNVDMTFVVPDVRFTNEVIKLEKYCQDNNFILELNFCNYKSEKYNASDPNVSEKLAQDILKMPEIDQSKYCQDITFLIDKIKDNANKQDT